MKKFHFSVIIFFCQFILKISPAEEVYHNQFAIHVPHLEADQVNQLAEEHGFINLGPLGSLKNYYVLEHPHVNKRSTRPSHTHHKSLANNPHVSWFEQQKELKRSKRTSSNEAIEDLDDFNEVIPDPLFKKQWFLNQGAIDGSDMNVFPAWKKGFTGKHVVVTILDDGIQLNHPDLAQNYDAMASTDINGNDDDPTPRDNGDNKHGTRCAGEVAAVAFNEYCGVGVAYNASIGGVRMLDGMVNDAVEARALSLNPNHIDIYSASWGPEDDGKTVDGPGPLAKKAFINGINQGRNGKGSIFVWASGNGGRQTDNCNCDGYTNSIYTLSISSATQGGRKPWYLEECSSTLATTYSSGTPGHDASIATVDEDKRLRPNNICTSSHTGTSASAPIAAGICALVLQANPQLSWRDMQHLVVQTANPNPLQHEDGWSINGVGRKFSHKFGYGLMDASAMVDLAQQWSENKNIGPQKECSSPVMNQDLNLAKKANDVVKQAVSTDGCRDSSHHSINVLEHVVCKITLKHNPRGSLHLVLISPMGTRSSLLLPRPRDKTDSGFENWPFLSVHFWGENPNGTWTLEITQNEGNTRKPGVLKSWQLIMYGTSSSQVTASGGNTNIRMKENQNLKEDGKKADSISREQDDDDHSNDDIEADPDDIKDVSVPEVLLPEVVHYEDAVVGDDGCHPECLNGCKISKNAAGGGPTALSPELCNECKNFNFSGYCVPACPNGAFQIPNQKSCQLCSKNCATCHGPLETQCLSCPRPKLLMNNETSICVKECPRGWRPNTVEAAPADSDDGDGGYEASSTSTTCVPCPPHCANCNSDNECENCLSGFYRRTDTQACVASCPDGQFADEATKTCQFCHADCDTCTGPRPTQCAKCKKGSHYFHRKCLKQDCPDQYFADLSISGECVPCPQGCKKCLSSDSCEECLDNDDHHQTGGGGGGSWKLINGKHCVPQLSATKCKQRDGMYFNNRTGTCLDCHAQCGTCFDGTPQGCLTCTRPERPLLHISSCLEESCPDQTFQYYNNECRHCAHSCKKCSSLLKCDVCHSGYFLTDTGHCVPSCPPGHFGKNGQCILCPTTCLECVNSTICSECESKTPLLTLGIRWYPSGGRAITVAGKPRHDYPMAIEINKRLENVATDQKLRTGKEVHPRRSDFVEWNYNTELIAFQARLGEKFDDNTLRQAFISLEYVTAQQKKLLELQNINSLESIEVEEDVVEEEDKEDLETTSSKSTIVSNEKLAEVGKRVILDSLRAYLRTSLPHLPEEGVEAITNFLTREELLAHVSFHIGTLDLVLSQEYPPSVQTMSQVFEALIGALAYEDEVRASKMVLDLVATQLHGQDLTDLWDLPDPMGTLEAILTKENRGLPEARLLWSSGKETILACYHVGVYSDRELIGQAPGESAMIAEEMAARDALRKLFKFDDASKPLPFGKELHKMKLKSTPNPTLEEWSSSNISIV